MRKALLICVPSRRSNREMRITLSSQVYSTSRSLAMMRKFCSVVTWMMRRITASRMTDAAMMMQVRLAMNSSVRKRLGMSTRMTRKLKSTENSP